jgi:predicted nuclease of predicted toxin-antitoxin system
MGTLSSELGSVLDEHPGEPRVYADANVPAGLVAFMRQELRWDVFFVMEHADLRRARDTEHYRLARELRRTLVTLDRDYFDDRRFPPAESSGVIVMSAPDERQLAKLLRRIDHLVLREQDAAGAPLNGTATAAPPARATLPLAGRKLHAHMDWPGPRSGEPRS